MLITVLESIEQNPDHSSHDKFRECLPTSRLDASRSLLLMLNNGALLVLYMYLPIAGLSVVGRKMKGRVPPF